MPKQTKESKARNESLYQTYSFHAERLGSLRADIESIIKESIFKEGGLDDGTISQLDYATHMYTFHADNVNAAWERYEDHCIAFDYDTKG